MSGQSDPFETLSEDYGEPSVSAGELARQMAREAIGATTAPGSRFTEMDTLPSEESQHLDFPDESGEEVELVPAEESVEELVDRVIDQAITPEDFAQLQDLGINIPVSPEDVPAEFQGTYARLVQAMVDMDASAQERVLDAQNAILKMQDFAERLQTAEGQRRLLLGLAMNAPEVFNQTADTIQRMNDDPEYADMIRRSLEAEVKLETATRKERALSQTELARKGQQIETRVERKAAALGVDVQTAKELVAARILQNESRTGTRDITLKEVDEVVDYLARRTAVRKPVKTPEQRAREERAPQKPAERAAAERAPAPEQTRRSDIAQPQDARDMLRNAVRLSSQRVRQSGL